MKNLDLQELFKLILALLLSLLPMYNIFAQAPTIDKQKQMRVKMFKNLNGEVQVIDTVVNVVDYAEALSSLKGFRADTVLLRKMNSDLKGFYKLDSTVHITRLKGTAFNSRGMKLDTAMFRRLHGDNVKVYKLDKTLSPADREKMFESIKAYKLDTAVFRALKQSKVHMYGTDSIRHQIFKRQIFSEDGDTIRFESMVPDKAFRMSTDSATFISIDKDGKLIKSGKHIAGFKPIDIQKIIVHSNGNHIVKFDSLAASGVTGHRLRFLNDEESGENRVYVIENDGKEHEITTEKLELTTGNKTVIIMLKADVKKISAEEKTKLENAGNKVEDSKKETLKIDDISVYPNPNDGRFNLNFSLDKEEDAAIRIMNSTGKVIYTETVEASTGLYNKQIDIAGIAKGIYYLQIVQGDRYATRKVLVQ